MFKIAIIANLATQSVLAFNKERPEFEGYKPSRPGYDRFKAPRARFDGYKPARPQNDNVASSRPGLDRFKAPRPRFDNYKPARPQNDNVASSRPEFNRFKAPRPDRFRPSPPNSDSYAPSRPQLDEGEAGRPDYDDYRPSRPQFGSVRPDFIRPSTEFARPSHDFDIPIPGENGPRPDIDVPSHGDLATHREDIPTPYSPEEDNSADVLDQPIETDPVEMEAETPLKIESSPCAGDVCYHSRAFVPRRYLRAPSPRQSFVGPRGNGYRHGFYRGNRRESTPVHRLARGPGPRRNGLMPEAAVSRSTYN